MKLKAKLLASFIILVALTALGGFLFSNIPTTEAEGESCPLPSSFTTCPEITDVKTSKITAKDAQISWNYNPITFLESANIYYGKTTAYDNTVSGFSPKLLTGLDPWTDYNFNIKVSESSTDKCESGNQTFKTCPDFTNINTIEITESSAVISWNYLPESFNQSSSATIMYGKTTDYGLTVSGPPNTALSNLEPLTTYHFKLIYDIDPDHICESQDNSFTTAAPVAFKIVNVQYAPFDQGSGLTYKTITWQTTSPATNTFNYWKHYESYQQPNPKQAVIVTSISPTSFKAEFHQLSLSTKYDFEITATKSANPPTNPPQTDYYTSSFTTGNLGFYNTLTNKADTVLVDARSGSSSYKFQWEVKIIVPELSVNIDSVFDEPTNHLTKTIVLPITEMDFSKTYTGTYEIRAYITEDGNTYEQKKSGSYSPLIPDPYFSLKTFDYPAGYQYFGHDRPNSNNDGITYTSTGQPNTLVVNYSNMYNKWDFSEATVKYGIIDNTLGTMILNNTGEYNFPLNIGESNKLLTLPNIPRTVDLYVNIGISAVKSRVTENWIRNTVPFEDTAPKVDFIGATWLQPYSQNVQVNNGVVSINTNEKFYTSLRSSNFTSSTKYVYDNPSAYSFKYDERPSWSYSTNSTYYGTVSDNYVLSQKYSLGSSDPNHPSVDSDETCKKIFVENEGSTYLYYRKIRFAIPVQYPNQSPILSYSDDRPCLLTP